MKITLFVVGTLILVVYMLLHRLFKPDKELADLEARALLHEAAESPEQSFKALRMVQAADALDDRSLVDYIPIWIRAAVIIIAISMTIPQIIEWL